MTILGWYLHSQLKTLAERRLFTRVSTLFRWILLGSELDIQVHPPSDHVQYIIPIYHSNIFQYIIQYHPISNHILSLAFQSSSNLGTNIFQSVLHSLALPAHQRRRDEWCASRRWVTILSGSRMNFINESPHGTKRPHVYHSGPDPSIYGMALHNHPIQPISAGSLSDRDVTVPRDL